MNMKNTLTILFIVRLLLGIAAIAFIIVSMVTDKVTPYLAIGMSLTAIANILNFKSAKGRKNFCRSGENNKED